MLLSVSVIAIVTPMYVEGQANVADTKTKSETSTATEISCRARSELGPSEAIR
jgi:hypothetical protein